MVIGKLEFTALEKKFKTTQSLRDCLAPEIGKAYAIVITRDNCQACVRQKPKLKSLADTLTKKHGGNLAFAEIHVKRPAGSDAESVRAKTLLGHYFYPTNLILLRTKDRGAIELYKNASPRITELKKNIEDAIRMAKAIKE